MRAKQGVQPTTYQQWRVPPPPAERTAACCCRTDPFLKKIARESLDLDVIKYSYYTLFGKILAPREYLAEGRQLTLPPQPLLCLRSSFPVSLVVPRGLVPSFPVLSELLLVWDVYAPYCTSTPQYSIQYSSINSTGL